MDAQLLTKTLTFPEAKRILGGLIRDLVEERSPVARPHVRRLELRVEKMDLISWLEQQDDQVKIFGSDQSDASAIAGIGEADVISGKGTVELPKIFARMDELLEPRAEYLRYYGGLCFDPQNPGADWEAFGNYRFILPRFELATKHGKMLFACNIVRRPGQTFDPSGVLRQLERLRFENRELRMTALDASERADNPGRDEWTASCKDVLKAFATDKDFKKIVLARRTAFTFTEELKPWNVLRQLKKVTPYSYHFCYQLGDHFFLGASPERLFRREGRSIESEAVAGTRPRGTTHRDDEHLREDLLKAPKDRQEHQYVIDAVTAALEPLCEHLEKDAAPGIISLQNGHHLVTEFKGRLKEKITDQEIISRLHPTPAVGGWPTAQAMDRIRKTEKFSRGWYAGAIGYVGSNETEFVVAIRSALLCGNTMTVYAGAGIIQGSTPDAEWLEIENKIGNFLKVLNY